MHPRQSLDSTPQSRLACSLLSLDDAWSRRVDLTVACDVPLLGPWHMPSDSVAAKGDCRQPSRPLVPFATRGKWRMPASVHLICQVQREASSIITLSLPAWVRQQFKCTTRDKARASDGERQAVAASLAPRSQPHSKVARLQCDASAHHVRQVCCTARQLCRRWQIPWARQSICKRWLHRRRYPKTVDVASTCPPHDACPHADAEDHADASTCARQNTTGNQDTDSCPEEGTDADSDAVQPTKATSERPRLCRRTIVVAAATEVA